LAGALDQSHRLAPALPAGSLRRRGQGALRADVDEGGFVAGLREIAAQVDGQRDDGGHSGILI
jgi:hypothetical protein